MLSLSQTTGYAILALSCLDGSNGRWMTTKEIAGETGIPKPYLSKILQAAGQAGLVAAKRGFGGGYVLLRPAGAITLFEVVEALEGRSWLCHCLLGLGSCSPECPCPAHEFWKTERGRIEDELRSVTLAEVAATGRTVRGAAHRAVAL